MKHDDDMKIVQKMYDLTLYLYQATQNFPRSERFALAADLRKNAYKILSNMVAANHSTKKKMVYLIETDRILNQERILLRLSRDIGILPFKKYSILFEGISEIGKMLGGWIKSVHKQG